MVSEKCVLFFIEEVIDYVFYIGLSHCIVFIFLRKLFMTICSKYLRILLLYEFKSDHSAAEATKNIQLAFWERQYV